MLVWSTQSLLYLITDRHQTAGRSLLEVLETSLQAGVRLIQLREKDLAVRPYLDLARKAQDLTRRHGAKLLINGRVDVALGLEADGVHLGHDALPPEVVRRIIPKGMLMGVSTHSLEEARAAEAAGADFVTFGPVFFTPSKARYGPPQGLEALREVTQDLSIPVYGLGGIKPENADTVLAAGASGLACISSILAAPDPAGAVRAFLKTIQGAGPLETRGSYKTH